MADDGIPRAASRAVSAAGRAIESIRARVEASVRASLSRLDTQEGSAKLEQSAAASRTGTSIAAAIGASLRRAADDVVDQGEQVAVDAAVATLGKRRQVPSEVIDEVEGVIAPLLREARESVLEGAQVARATIAEGLRRQTTADRLTEEVVARIDGAFSRAAVAVDSAVMGAHRVTQITAAELEADEPMGFLFLGPRGAKTRPFCREHVGKVYTREALDALDNGPGQPKPVSVHLGGFNCRHVASPITLRDAREQGYEVIT